MSDDQYARTGRAMFLFFWIILFVGLFAFFYYYGNSNSTVSIVNRNEIIIGSDQNGHYRIKGSINDSAVEFLLDTGATSVAIPQHLAEKLHVEGHYPVTISTANGEVTGSLTRIQQLSFGGFTFKNVKAVIIPGNDDELILLGMNVLSQFNLVQQDKKLILKEHRLDVMNE